MVSVSVSVSLRMNECLCDTRFTFLRSSSMRRNLSLEEIKAIQTRAQSVQNEAFRQQMQMLNERSTLFDVLRAG